jgi:hypothetical protein
LLWRNVRPHGDTGQITVFGKNGKTRSIPDFSSKPPAGRAP